MINKVLIEQIALDMALTPQQVKKTINAFCLIMKEEYFDKKIGVDIRKFGKFYYRLDLERVRQIQDEWRKEGIAEDEIKRRTDKNFFNKVRGELGYEITQKRRQAGVNYYETYRNIIIDDTDIPNE